MRTQWQMRGADGPFSRDNGTMEVMVARACGWKWKQANLRATEEKEPYGIGIKA